MWSSVRVCEPVLVFVWVSKCWLFLARTCMWAFKVGDGSECCGTWFVQLGSYNWVGNYIFRFGSSYLKHVPAAARQPTKIGVAIATNQLDAPASLLHCGM